MGRWRKNSKEAKIRKELIHRFHQQERISMDKVVRDYFEPGTVYSALVAKKAAKAIMNSVKNHFKKEGIPFGSVNEHEEWGIPTMEEEFRYALKRRYKNVKGTVINSETLWVRSAKRMGYLKDLKHEKMLVAKQVNGEENESTDKSN